MESFASNETEVVPIRKKKRHGKHKKYIPVKFDKEGFLMAWGLGIVFIGLGVLIIWATKTAPDVTPQSMALTTTQRIVRLMPESVKETIAFILGNLFMLFGVVSIFLGLKLAVKYIAKKLR